MSIKLEKVEDVLDRKALREQRWRRDMTFIEKALFDAVCEAQANHHRQCVMQRTQAMKSKQTVWNSQHRGAHWQHCEAFSCQRVANIYKQLKKWRDWSDVPQDVRRMIHR